MSICPLQLIRVKLMWGLLALSLLSDEPPSSLNSDSLLREAVAQIAQNTVALPKFTCTETVERSFYRRRQSLEQNGASLSAADLFESERDAVLAWSDQFRLALAIFDGRELFSWPGGGAFQHEWPDELIGGGASTSGEFGPFAVNVLLSDAAALSLRFVSVSKLEGSDVAEYKYSVPLELTHFSVKVGDRRAVKTAFEGSVFINVQDHDLKRMIVNILNPPPASGLQQGRIVTDYAREQVGDARVLLPQHSTTTLSTGAADLAVNRTQYTDCKEFAAESAVHFGEFHPASNSATLVEQRPLPPGLRFAARFLTPIDSEQSFAGDRVEAKVVSTVKVGRQRVISKNARLYGRIVGLHRQFLPGRQVTLSIQFDHLEMNGTQVPVSLAAFGPSFPFCDSPNCQLPSTESQAPGDSMVRHIAEITRPGTDRLHFSAGSLWVWQTVRLSSEPQDEPAETPPSNALPSQPPRH
jgi:hypothetical protein